MAIYTTQPPPPFYGPSTPQFLPSTDIDRIHAWLPWSVINLFIGWGLGGLIPLVFSILCRSNKNRNDVQGARLMGNLALIFNILISIGGTASWIGFIIWIIWYIRVGQYLVYTY